MTKKEFDARFSNERAAEMQRRMAERMFRPVWVGYPSGYLVPTKKNMELKPRVNKPG